MSLISQTLNYTRPGTYTFTVPNGVSTLDMYLWGAGGAQGQSGAVSAVQVSQTSREVQTGTRRVEIGTELVQTGTRQVQTGTRQVQVGTKRVQVGTREIPGGTQRVQVGTERVFVTAREIPGGTQRVQVGETPVFRTETVVENRPRFETQQVQVGTQQVQTGTRLEAYTVQVPQQSSGLSFSGPIPGGIGFLSPGGSGGKNQQSFRTVTEYREVPVYTTQPVYETRQVQVGTDQVVTTRQVQTGTEPVFEIRNLPSTFENIFQDQPIYEFQNLPPRIEPVFQDQPIYADEPIFVDEPIFETRTVFGSEGVFTIEHSPVFESRSGGNGGLGGGGGFAKTQIRVSVGDVVTLVVGAPGTNFSGGSSFSGYQGGSAGTATEGGRGGGGGGATVLLVNGTVVAVAAGGGGGGGGGTNDRNGTNGQAARNSGISNSTSGQNSVNNVASGGGGGGGHFGGDAGSGGFTGSGGQGGVNLGTIILAGNGANPGGFTDANYPGSRVGTADQSGGATLVATKSFNIDIKQSGQWKSVDSGFVKVNNNWEEILNGWTKVDGTWEPLISDRSITGAIDLAAPVITHSLSANVATVEEGETVGFTLTTTGLSNGTLVPYIASGVESTDLSRGNLVGNFVIGTTDTIEFTPRPNQITNDSRTLRVVITNTTAAASCLVIDDPNNPDSTTLIKPTLDSTFSFLTSDYTDPELPFEYKATALIAEWDDDAGGTQKFSLSLSSGLTLNSELSTSGTSWSGSSTDAVFVLIGPHPSGTATLTVSRSGYQNRVRTVSIPANARYSPYNLSRGFPEEFSLSSTQRSYAAQIATLYYESISTPYSVTKAGLFPTWYGLGRRADADGLAYWARWLTQVGSTPQSQLFRNVFFDAVNAAGPSNVNYQASRLADKAFRPGTGYDKFEDRP